MSDKKCPKLLACPFCGGRAFYGVSLRLGMYYVKCHKKKCIIGNVFTNLSKTKREAAIAWNERMGFYK